MSKLRLNGTSSGYVEITAPATAANNTITLPSDTGSIIVQSTTGITSFASAPVVIGTGTSTGTASQTLQVTGGAYVSGNVGIGTTNPTQRLELGGSAYTALDIKSTGGIISRIVSNDSSSSLDIGTLSNNVINFYTGNSYRGRFDTSGNIQIANGNLVFSTAGTGIDFSATGNGSGTMTSELLNDYEVGTWTPTLPNGGTLSVSSASYTKIGNLVYLYFYVSNVQPTNNSSEFAFGGLPFTCSTATHYPSGSIGYVGAGNLTGWTPLVNNGASFVYFHFTNGTGGGARAANSQWVSANNNGPIIVTICYQTGS